MSPELLALDQSGLKNGRPTKQSDCYALGMVIYEVLSGRVPFSQFGPYIVIWKVMDGERPERPKGVEGAWFTNELWQMLTRCWATQPESRPSVAAVLECLERVSRDPGPPSLQGDGNLGRVRMVRVIQVILPGGFLGSILVTF
jgi:serine/threonine protein kinase